MNELMVVLASVIPEENIIDLLQASITKYKLAPSIETKRDVVANCALMVAKHATDESPDGVLGVLKDLDRIKQADDLLKPKSN